MFPFHRTFAYAALLAACTVPLGCNRGHVSEAELARELRAVNQQVTAYRPPNASPVLPVETPYLRASTVAETAADALGRIGEQAIPGLIAALDSPQAEVRLEASHALALMGTKASPAVAALVKRLDDADEDVRRNAARALGQIGPAAASAVPALLKLLEEPDDSHDESTPSTPSTSPNSYPAQARRP